MSLISILVYAVAALTVLSGFSILVGSSKAERGRMAWFFFAALFAALWAVSISIFLTLAPGSDALAYWSIAGIYLSAALMMLSLLGFTSGHTIWGKVLTVLSLIYVVIVFTLVISDPHLLINSYTLSTAGNSVDLVKGWVYLSYTAFFMIASAAGWVAIFLRSRSVRLNRVKKGDLVLLVGLVITGLFAFVADLLLPYLGRYDLIWVGPLSLSVTMIAFYYSLLRFRIISISSNWLKILSSIVLAISGVIIYMLIFYLIFTTLFKIPNPSTAILVLNFLMIVIVLLLMPVINELSASIRSLISVGQVDIAYVIKKLNHLATKNVDLRDLAGFLADHLHFAYIGFIINGHLYGSKSLAVSAEELSQITHLKSTNGDIWQEPSSDVEKMLDGLGLKAVAELHNAKGKTFGQLIVGKPMGKTSFERRDLIQLEMIINLVATVIDSEKHLRA